MLGGIPQVEPAAAASEPRDVASRFARAVVRWPRTVIGLALLVTGVLGVPATRLQVHTDPDATFPPAHPYVVIDRKLRHEFGGWNYVLLAVEGTNGTVWDEEVLRTVYEVTQAVRALPGLLPTSLVSLASPNVRRLTACNGGLDVRYLMRHPPHGAKKVAALRSVVRQTPLFATGLVSPDERAAVVAADFDDGVTAHDVTERLFAIADRYASPAVRIRVTGGPVLIESYNAFIFQVWYRFALTFVVIAGVLFLGFGTLQGVVIPLASGGLATLWAVGIMGWLGIPLDQWNTMTPILVMTVTAGHSTQLLKRYYEELAHTADNRVAVVRSLAAIAPVMVAAGTTAAVGFASLTVFTVPSMRTFGCFTALGIACGLVVELTFMPALRSLLAPGTPPRPRLDRALAVIAGPLVRSFTSRGGRAAWGSAAVGIAAVAAWGVSRVRTDFAYLDYLPDRTRGGQDFRAVQRLFPGTLPLVVLVEGDDAIAQDPALLRLVDGLQRTLARAPEVVYTASYVDVLEHVARTLDDGTGLPEALFTDERIPAQLLFLSYSPQYERFLTRDLRRVAIWAFLRESPTERIADVLADAQRFVDAAPGSSRWRVQIAGGMAATRIAITDDIVRGKMLNVAIVLGVIGAVAALIFRSAVAGGLVLLPLAFTILVDLGLLGLLGLPLDPITATVAAMAVGIGADYAIYLIYRLRQERMAGGGEEAVFVRAVTGAGRGVAIVALAITGGYLMLAFSGFRAFTVLGLLVSTTMLFSSTVSLTLLPLVIRWARPRVVFGPTA